MKESKSYKECMSETVQILDFIVDSLGTDIDLLQFQLNDIITERKSMKRVRPEHWGIMGKALLSTLKEKLGDKFDRECRESWDYAFDSISEMMIDAMKR